MSTAEIITDRIARSRKRCSSDGQHPDSGLHDAQLAQLLNASPLPLVHRLRRIRAQAKVSSQGSFLGDPYGSSAQSASSRSSWPAGNVNDAGTCPAAIGELHWRDHVLTWTRGCKLIRSFTFPEPVLQALWAKMEVESPDPIERAPSGMRMPTHSSAAATTERQRACRTRLCDRGAFSALQRHQRDAPLRQNELPGPSIPHDAEAARLESALCVVFEQGILIHFPGRGEEYQIDLPFRPARAFPMPVGLFLLRQTENEDVEIADRIDRQHKRLKHDGSSLGYPFPHMAASMLDPQTPDFGPIDLPTDDLDDDDDDDELASNILPMAFHLRRPFDELAQVDRYPQISESVSGTADKVQSHLVHGPATPFTEVDETVVYVSPCGSQSPYPVLVTASHRTGSIRIYAFSTTPTRPVATSIILSSRVPLAPRSSSTTAAMHDSDATSLPLGPDSSLSARMDGLESDNVSRDALDPSAAVRIGRGLPPTRKSGRMELERRSSSKSVPMGRDPSGRSRRISAMHAGSNERRLASRVEDVGPLARDRNANGTGNMSQTVDGLRRQSQALTQEAMLGELGAGNASVRIASSSARLRRSSHAVRTPYAGPRTAARQPGTAARTPAARARLSVSMPRPDASGDNFDLSSYPAGGPSTGKLGTYDRDGMESGDLTAQLAEVDVVSGLADLDNFARSFAAVALLEEIKVEEIRSPDDAQKIEVLPVRLSENQNSMVHLYISVPIAGKTFVRQVHYRTYGSELGLVRRALHSGKPDASSAFPTLDTSALAVLPPTTGKATSDVISMEQDGSLTLHISPVGPKSSSIRLGSWRRWSVGRHSEEEDMLASLPSPPSRLRYLHGSLLQVEFSGRQSKATLDVDFGPQCPLTQRVLRLLSAALPSSSYGSLKAAWITHRFGLDKPLEQAEEPVPGQDWAILQRVLAPKPTTRQARSAASVSSDAFTRLGASLSHAEGFGTDVLSCIAALPVATTAEVPPIAATASDGDGSSSVAKLSSADCQTVAACLHMLAQESRLDGGSTASDLPRLVVLLKHVASRCALDGWLEYWQCSHPSSAARARTPLKVQTMDPRLSAHGPPFDIYAVLAKQLKGKAKATVPDLLMSLVPVPATVSPAASEVLVQVCRKMSCLLELYSLFAPEGSRLADAASNTSGPSSNPNRAHAVVERMVGIGLGAEDLRTLPFGLALPLLEAVRSSQLDPPMGWSSDAYRMVHRADLAMHTLAGSAGHSTDLNQNVAPRLLRAMPKRVQLDPLCAQIFSEDFRLVDVVKMLESTRINVVYVPETENQPESSVNEQHAQAVGAVTERTKAIPVGRGMLFMASKPFCVTQKWQIPQLCLSVKVVPRGTTVETDGKAESAQLEWPEFHNGVASILEISVAPGSKVDSKWIFSHLGEEPTAKHAGFLFGLGLTKHLPALTPVHVFRYLKARHNLLTIGFLLGLAAAAVGTGDPAARHLLGMQLVAFLPPGSAPLNLSIITQTAGLLAMGLVFLGSNHRWTAKRMLQQIGAPESPIPDVQSQHREAYSLSAGLGLGMVMLGKGRTDGMSSVPDKRILAKLEQLTNGSLADLRRSRRRPDPAMAQLNPDLSLTSIPASVALGLMFLRSNRTDIADILWIPDSHDLLNYIRPDVLLVRVLARHLILWDQIRCSSEWIDGVLPEMIRAQARNGGQEMSEAAQLASINMKAGACFAMGLKHAGSQDPAARACLLQQLLQLNQDAQIKPISYFAKIRQSAIRAAADLVTVCLAAVMAGSGDLEILRVLRMAHGDLESERSYGSHMATHMAMGLLFLGGGRLTLGSSDSAVAALLVAFFPRFPSSSSDNRAHLQAFRHLWVLAVEPRLLIAKDIETGEAASLPLRLQLARNDAQGPSVTTREFAPTLLPGLDRVEAIRTDTARYWPASLLVGESLQHAETLLHSRILHVQRKTGYLSYIDDPKGSRSIFSRSLGTAPLDLGHGAEASLAPSIEELRELVHGFASAGKHGELVERICNAVSAGGTGMEQDGYSARLKAFLRTSIMECLTLDKAYMIPSYVSLALAMDLKPCDGASGTLADLMFAEHFYETCFDRLVTPLGRDGQAETEEQRRQRQQQQAARLPLIQRGLLSKLLRGAQRQGREALESREEVRRAFAAQIRGSAAAEPAEVSTDVQEGETEVQATLSLLAVAEGQPRLEVVRQLAGLVRSAAIEARQNSSERLSEADRVALVSSLVVRAQLAYRSSDEAAAQEQEGQRWSDYLLERTVEAAVEDVLV